MLSGEEIVSSIFPMVLGKLDIHTEKNTFEHLVYDIYKNELKMDINVSANTINFLEENRGKAS